MSGKSSSSGAKKDNPVEIYPVNGKVTIKIITAIEVGSLQCHSL